MGAIILAPLYLLMNLYLAVRILLWFQIVGGPPGSTWFTAVFMVLFLAAMLSPLPAAFAQGRTKRITNRISNYWLGVLMYLLIFLLLSDVLWGVFCLVTHRPLLSIFGMPAPTIREVFLLLRTHSTAKWQQSGASSIYLWTGTMVLAATAGISIFGVVHARRVQKVTYPVTIHKECQLPAPTNRETVLPLWARPAADHREGAFPSAPTNRKAVLPLWARPATDHREGAFPSAPTLKIALVADLHLGYSVGLKRVQDIVQIINDMEPDLVVFAGDLFDNAFDAIPDPEGCAAALASIKSTYGSYACWGNHDVEERILAGFTFDSGHNKSAQPKAQSDSPMAQMLRTSGIRLLEDETILIGDAFYLTGRLDASCSAHQPRSGSSIVGASCRRPQGGGVSINAHQPRSGSSVAGASCRRQQEGCISIEEKSGHIRKTPAELTTKLTNASSTMLTHSDEAPDSTACSARIDPDKPFIVIDHQPSEIKELAAAGADLILSGHTHDGQIFPANLITRLSWMNSYGKLVIGNTTSIVTSGAGTWGPAMRVGTDNEVVEIAVTFEPQER